MTETRAEYITAADLEPLPAKELEALIGDKWMGLLTAIIADICKTGYGRVEIIIRKGCVLHIDAVKQYKPIELD